ncbi:MAG: L,D-transpeptidase [Elainellaceae cyanobacterium]
MSKPVLSFARRNMRSTPAPQRPSLAWHWLVTVGLTAGAALLGPPALEQPALGQSALGQSALGQSAADLASGGQEQQTTAPASPRPDSVRSAAPASGLPYSPPLSPRYPSDSGFLLPPRPLFPEIRSTELRLVLRLSDRRVYVYRGDEVEVSYPVAVGKSGWETPMGSYEVSAMIEDPSWENPFTGDVIPAGPDNPLGEHWIGFWTDGNNFIGFHGTPNEGSVGRAASHGCVRMYNSDIRELFTVVAMGTPVIVEQ